MTETVYYRTTYPYYPAIFASRVINIVIGIIEMVLLIRIVLELFGANAGSSFVAFIYNISDGLMGPFANAFSNMSLTGASVLDINAILAIIVYAVIGWILSVLLSAIFNATATAA